MTFRPLSLFCVLSHPIALLSFWSILRPDAAGTGLQCLGRSPSSQGCLLRPAGLHGYPWIVEDVRKSGRRQMGEGQIDREAFFQEGLVSCYIHRSIPVIWDGSKISTPRWGVHGRFVLKAGVRRPHGFSDVFSMV